MIKGIVFIKRKPGLSRGEFREQYESVHAPLVLKKYPTLSKFVRNYIITTNAFASGAAEPDFDCITEYWFDDMEGFRAMMEATKGDSGQALRHSAQVFVDSTEAVYLLVDEVESEIT